MSDRFVHELPLESDQITEPILDLRFEAARVLYNACLREILRRLDLMKASKEWQRARNLPRGSERNTLFKTVIKKHCFSEYDLHTWLTTFIKLFPLRNHLDSQVCQKIATRAFGAAKESSLAKRGRPRFKGYGQFASIEGKSNLTGIRFKEGEVLWMGVRLHPLFSIKDPYGVEAHALNSTVKYVRLVRRQVRGHKRYYVQLILEGKPLVKRKASLGKVGIDLGPSTIATVSEKGSFLETLTPLSQERDQIKKIQKKISRSYEKNGKKISNRCHALKRKAAEKHRVLKAKRKCQIGKQINKVLALGREIYLEKLSYKNFQRDYGKSVQSHAPGEFVERLRYRAENAGGKVTDINTYATKLSQVCQCGREAKKPLSERWHECECGVNMQRDLYSAFLALHVEENSLDRSTAQLDWPGAEPLLRQALSRCVETARDRQEVVRFGLSQRQSGSPAKDGSTHSDAKDVVGYPLPRASESYAATAIRTPCFSYGERLSLQAKRWSHPPQF